MPDCSQELVTVVIPLYNKRSTVERAVRSVLQQTHTALELWIVDDGSTDASIEAIQHLQDPRIRLLSTENRGPGAARNAGWREGHGRIVAFLDADDFWQDDFLEWAVERLTIDQALAACTAGYRETSASGTSIPGAAYWAPLGLRAGKFRADHATDPAQLLATLTYMFPVTTVVRRSVLEAFGGFFDLYRCTYGEDSFLWLQVLLNYPVLIDYTPRVTVDRTSSSLSTPQTLATRSIEPLLTHAAVVRDACPAALSGLLAELLARKAYKRACTLAAVGRWQDGKVLRAQFRMPGAWRRPYGLASKVLVNPAGAALARAALQVLRRIRSN